MKKVLLTTCNAKYIHKNLALRWLYTTAPHKECVTIREYTIKEQEEWIAQDILSVQPEVVCFSCYIWNIQLIRRVIVLLKQQNSNLHILVGGPEVSYESYDLLDEGVDAISIGEGEQSGNTSPCWRKQKRIRFQVFTQSSIPIRNIAKLTLHGWSALKHRISWKWMRRGWTGSIFIWRQAEAVHTAAPTACPPPIELSACFPWSIS